MIHPSACIAPGAKIGQGVSIAPFAVIDEHVSIGDGCVIGPHVHLTGWTTIGAGTSIHAGAVVGDAPQDLGYKGEEAYVVVGERCVIREYVTIQRGHRAGHTTRVGNGVLLMAYSHVGHDCVVGDNVIIANGTNLAGHVQVGERAFLSAHCDVHQFCRVGRLAMLGGQCGLNRDLPPFCLYAVDRLCGINTVGLRRSGISPQARTAVRAAVRTYFLSGLGTAEALERMRQEQGNVPEVAELCDFIAASKRGIMRSIQRGGKRGEMGEADDGAATL